MEHIELSNAASIILYILVGAVSVACMRRAEKFYLVGESQQFSRETRSVIVISKSSIYLILSVTTLALPAVFRYLVGIDYGTYLVHSERMANATSIYSAMSMRNVEDSFAILSYLSGKLLGTSVGVFSFYALFTQIFMVLGIWNFKEKVSPSVALLVYYCTFYFRTYNIFRQALAVAIVFYSIGNLLNKKYTRFLVAVIIAGFFHTSAYISLLMLYYFRLKDQYVGGRRLIEYLLPLLVLVFLEVAMDIVFSIPVFAKYATNYRTITQGSILTVGTLLKASFWIVYFVSWRKKARNKNDAKYLELFTKFLICDAVVYILTFYIRFASRIGLYFSVPVAVAIASLIPKKWKYNGIREIPINILYVVAFCVLSFYSVMSSNGYGQLPYRFWY